MVVPTGSNLYSETWNIVHGLISGNVADPILATRSSDKLKFIHSAFPDVEKTFPGFPIIVIDNPEASSTPTTFTTNGQIAKDMRISAWAYSKSNQQVNVLADAITNTFLANRAALQLSGLQISTIDAGAQGTDIYGNQRVHYREIQAGLKMVV